MQGRIIIHFSLLSFLFSVALILISCGGGSGGNNLPDAPEQDTIKPTVTITPETPPTGQTVPVATTITAVFSEKMNAKSVVDGFIVVPNNSGTIQYDDSTKTASYIPDPNVGTDLQGDANYTVTLKNTIKDKANNNLLEKTWTFKTEDNVNPILRQCIPKCESTNSDTLGVPLNLQISLIFNEPMFIDSFTDLTVEVKSLGVNGKALKGIFSVDTINPNKIIWKPASTDKFIPLTNYVVTVLTGVEDNSPSHNKLLEQKIFTFTTAQFVDTFSPSYKILSPVDKSKNNPPSSVIKVEFTNSDGSPEVMDWNSIDSKSFVVKNENGDQIFGQFQHDPITNVLTFTPGTIVSPTTPKNLSLLETYTITLMDTIQDLAGNFLTTNNNVASTFYTSDGSIEKNATQIGISNNWDTRVHISTKNDGAVYALWQNAKDNFAPKKIMKRTYKPGNGWDTSSVDITANILTPKFTNLSHSLGRIAYILTDINDHHIIVWRDVDNTNNTSTATAYNLSEWIRLDSQTDVQLKGQWNAPQTIMQNSLAHFMIRTSTYHQSKNGTVTFMWGEIDKTLFTGGEVIQMRQLKSNDGTFGTSWSPITRITKNDQTLSGLTEYGSAIGSDSAGNLFVFYIDNPSDPKLNQVFNLVKYPFPSSNVTQLENLSVSNVVIDSSKGNILVGWENNIRNINGLNYDTNKVLNTNNTKLLGSGTFYRGAGKTMGVAQFPLGDGIQVFLENNNAISYAEYDSTIQGWKPTQTLITPVSVTQFKFFHGSRNIVTIAWSDNSKIYIKRYKAGVNFGWQPTQSINAPNIQFINITSSMDGHAIIVWASYKPTFDGTTIKSNLSAIRLK